MKIRKYVARNMPEALQQVRDDLGENAVILSTRQLRRNNRFNLHDEARVEVTAAFDEAAPAGKVASPEGVATRQGVTLRENSSAVLEDPMIPAALPGTVQAGKPSFVAQRYASSQSRAVQAESRPAAADPAPPSSPPLARPAPPLAGRSEVAAPPDPGRATAEVGALFGQLRQLQESVARIRRWGGPGIAMPQALERLVERLEHVGVARELIDRLVQQLFEELTGKGLDDRARVGERAAALLARWMPPCQDIKIGRRRKVIGFFGAAGAGKTTAAAKIAAGFAMKRGERILLVSADDRRVGALDQARAFAQIIGVPFEVAFTEEEIRAVLARGVDARLVLVDPAGCGPHDRQEQERQCRLFAAAGVDEVQVVIDARSGLDNMLDQLEASAGCGERRLLFTKLDEVLRPGAVLSAAAKSQIATSYFTTGAAVPGEIESGNLGRLVAKMMGISSISPGGGQ